jgi:lysophospholipase L1-like esterase
MRKRALLPLLFIITVISAEFSAGMIGFGHPLLYKSSSAGYELAPHQSANRFSKFTHINALGTRGPETTRFPASGVYRILVIGDSVANGGTRINDDQTWPMQLQKALAGMGRPVEVVNAAAGGWAVQNEAAWLHEHGTLGARLILLEINEKDLDQSFVGPELLDTNTSFPSKTPSSALGELFTRYMMPRLGLRITSADPGSTASAFQEQNTAAVLDAVEAIRTLAEADGAELAIFYWDLRLPTPMEVVSARSRLFTYAAQHEITVIRPDLKKNYGGTLFFRDDIHPNVAGNATIAQKLSERLQTYVGDQTRQPIGSANTSK